MLAKNHRVISALNRVQYIKDLAVKGKVLGTSEKIIITSRMLVMSIKYKSEYDLG